MTFDQNIFPYQLFADCKGNINGRADIYLCWQACVVGKLAKVGVATGVM